MGGNLHIQKILDIMKKTYIAPALDVQLIQLEGLVALSKFDGEPATGDDALVKENCGEDIWGTSSKSSNVWDDNWSE